MKLIKNNKIIFVILLFLVILSIGGTIAYYYQNIVIPNEFQTLLYNVTIDEDFNNEWGTKKVYITNNEISNSNVLIRVNYNEIWSKKIGNTLVYLSNTINGTNVVDKGWTDTFSNDFIDGLDGWYYYKKLLAPNETIRILNSISLNNNLIEQNSEYEEYLDYNYKLIFNYEAIELNAVKVSNIWNKNITIDGSNVTWGN